jgi:hypothetical protein
VVRDTLGGDRSSRDEAAQGTIRGFITGLVVVIGQQERRPGKYQNQKQGEKYGQAVFHYFK